MKRKTYIGRIGLSTAVLTLGAAMTLATGGCAASNDAQSGLLLGTAAGAGLGAIIGHNTGRRTAEGAAIGAGVGALSGYIIGNESDKAKSRYDHPRHYRY